jgi:hypothetical protein
MDRTPFIAIYGKYICDLYQPVLGTPKVFSFSFLMGIFDWCITKKFKIALDSPTIDKLQSPPLGCHNLG